MVYFLIWYAIGLTGCCILHNLEDRSVNLTEIAECLLLSLGGVFIILITMWFVFTGGDLDSE